MPPRFRLTANAASFLKARNVQASALSDAERLRINIGDQIEAEITFEDAETCILAKSILNGLLPVQPSLRYAYFPHWTNKAVVNPTRDDDEVYLAYKQDALQMLGQSISVHQTAKTLFISKSTLQRWKILAVIEAMAGL